MPSDYKPIFIIGAGRSGTNILRDTLTQIPSWETWDCDEINLIWRHGNLLKSHDIFSAKDSNEKIANFIRGEFDKLHRRTQAKVIVEKTCANSLRVDFIKAIFPEARFIYITRDGRDVALSAAKRWTASIEPSYLLKKIKFVPLQDIPFYGWNFIKNRLYQLGSNERRQASWGPRFPGMSDWVRDKPLIEVCAKQWAVCVEESDRAFSGMPSETVKKIKYESLVANPSEVMKELCNWVEADIFDLLSADALTRIHPASANGWQKKIELFTDDSLSIMSDALGKHGYETST